MAGENSTSTERVPDFSEPRTFVSPQIANLIQDSNYVCEDGISFLGIFYLPDVMLYSDFFFWLTIIWPWYLRVQEGQSYWRKWSLQKQWTLTEFPFPRTVRVFEPEKIVHRSGFPLRQWCCYGKQQGPVEEWLHILLESMFPRIDWYKWLTNWLTNFVLRWSYWRTNKPTNRPTDRPVAGQTDG